MPGAGRRSIVFCCIALILFAALTPGAWLHAVILIPLGFVITAPLSVPADIASFTGKPQDLHLLPIRSPRPPPVG
jgi:hypothetical protein